MWAEAAREAGRRVGEMEDVGQRQGDCVLASVPFPLPPIVFSLRHSLVPAWITAANIS